MRNKNKMDKTYEEELVSIIKDIRKRAVSKAFEVLLDDLGTEVSISEQTFSLIECYMKVYMEYMEECCQ